MKVKTKSVPDGGIEVPNITVLSETRVGSPEWRKLANYVTSWINTPRPDSKFYDSTALLRKLPSLAQIGILGALRYDVLFLTLGEKKKEEIIGHVAFQRHDDALHMFSVSVDREEHQGRGYATYGLEEFVRYAQRKPGIRRVRLGAGGHALVVRIYENMRKREEELGIKVRENGWIDLRRR